MGGLSAGISKPGAGGDPASAGADASTTSSVSNSFMTDVIVRLHVAPSGATAGHESYVSVGCQMSFMGANVAAEVPLFVLFVNFSVYFMHIFIESHSSSVCEAYWGRDPSNFDQWASFIAIGIGFGSTATGSSAMQGNIGTSGPGNTWQKASAAAGGLPSQSLTFLFNSFKSEVSTAGICMFTPTFQKLIDSAKTGGKIFSVVSLAHN